METNAVLLVSLILLVAAFALGAVDGAYFHLQKFRLFERAESRWEHVLHTIRACLAVPTLVLLYLLEPSGILLVAAAVVVLADQVVLVLDLIAEHESRQRMGGIPHAEYMIHVGANGLHAVALALAFASRPLQRWDLAGSFETSALPDPARWLVVALIVLAAVAAVQHVLLLRLPFAPAPLPAES